MVEDVEVVTTVPRALLQGHRKDEPLAVANEADLELLAGRHRRYGRHDVLNTNDAPSIHRQQNITRFEAVIGSRRVRKDGLDQNPRPPRELLARSDIV